MSSQTNNLSQRSSNKSSSSSSLRVPQSSLSTRTTPRSSPTSSVSSSPTHSHTNSRNSMDTDFTATPQKLDNGFADSSSSTPSSSSSPSPSNAAAIANGTVANMSAFANSLYYFDPSYDGPLVYVYPFGYVSLFALLRQQLEYYFSVDNLVRDVYLRSQMNSRGYVPLNVIMAFNRIRSLVADDSIVIAAARTSSLLKVKRGGIRVREGWKSWIFPQTQKQDKEEVTEEAQSSEEEWEYEGEGEGEEEEYVEEEQTLVEEETPAQTEEAENNSSFMQQTQTV